MNTYLQVEERELEPVVTESSMTDQNINNEYSEWDHLILDREFCISEREFTISKKVITFLWDCIVGYTSTRTIGDYVNIENSPHMIFSVFFMVMPYIISRIVNEFTSIYKSKKETKLTDYSYLFPRSLVPLVLTCCTLIPEYFKVNPLVTKEQYSLVGFFSSRLVENVLEKTLSSDENALENIVKKICPSI